MWTLAVTVAMDLNALCVLFGFEAIAAFCLCMAGIHWTLAVRRAAFVVHQATSVAWIVAVMARARPLALATLATVILAQIVGLLVAAVVLWIAEHCRIRSHKGDTEKRL